MIFFGEASFQHAVTEYIEHYHQERTHQGKDNRLLFPQQPTGQCAVKNESADC
jgi:putative transposase